MSTVILLARDCFTDYYFFVKKKIQICMAHLLQMTSVGQYPIIRGVGKVSVK